MAITNGPHMNIQSSLMITVMILSWVCSIEALSATGNGIPFRLAFDSPIPQCDSCHGWRSPNPKIRPLNTPHNTITLSHGPDAKLWCLDCHEENDPGRLRLPNQEKTEFTDAHRLCVTCHGKTVTSWQNGAHGKRVSGWSEQRVMLRCSACHNPHQPQWQPVAPAPPPYKPQHLP